MVRFSHLQNLKISLPESETSYSWN